MNILGVCFSVDTEHDQVLAEHGSQRVTDESIVVLMRAFAVGPLALVTFATFAACAGAPPVALVAPVATVPAATSRAEGIGAMSGVAMASRTHGHVTELPAAGASVRCAEDGTEAAFSTRVFVTTAAGTAELPSRMAGGDYPHCDDAAFTAQVVPARDGVPSYTVLRHGPDAIGVFVAGPTGPVLVDASCDVSASLTVTATTCGPTLTCRERNAAPQFLAVFGPSRGVAPARGCQLLP